jgi:dTMP kinase
LTALFITLEGPEGSGKTTQARLLLEYLREEGYSVVLTREPGGTRISDKVREVLLDPNNSEILPRTEILLFSAARAQLSDEFITPHLQQGDVVICDRYADSTMAYQGYGHELDLETLRRITAFATGGLQPDLTIYLDVPVEVGLKRRRGMVTEDQTAAYEVQLPLFAKWDRLDMKEVEFHRRVQRGYEKLMEAEPQRWFKVDAERPVEQIRDDIRAKVLSLLEDRA